MPGWKKQIDTILRLFHPGTVRKLSLQLERARFSKPHATADPIIAVMEQRFSLSHQEDCYEFLFSLLRQIDAPLMHLSTNISLTKTVACTKCFYSDIDDEQNEPALCLSLRGPDVQSCIESYQEENFIAEYQCNLCSQDQRLTLIRSQLLTYISSSN